MAEMGITLHTGDLSTKEIVRYAQEAEALGYEGFWITEESGKNAFSLLSLIAHDTEEINLYTGIVSYYSRTPMLLAMSTRTIWDMSSGRFGLGIGTGGVGFLLQGHGLELERPVGRARETVEIVRKFLTEERFSHEGDWFNVRNFHLREGPIEGHVPIYLAALGPQMVRTAAKYFDGFITNWITRESLVEFKQLVAEGCAEVDRDPSEVKIIALEMTTADPDSEASMDAMRRGCAFYFASEHYHHISDISGYGEEAKKIHDVWKTRDYDRAAQMVTDEMLQKFTLTGPRESCIERLNWLLQEGVHPIIYPVPRHSHMVEDHFTTMERAMSYRTS